MPKIDAKLKDPKLCDGCEHVYFTEFYGVNSAPKKYAYCERFKTMIFRNKKYGFTIGNLIKRPAACREKYGE